MEKRLVDRILELKSRCRFEEEICAECDLSLPEVRCVGALQPSEQLSAGDLAGRLDLSPSRASRVITAVRERGLVVESLDPRDRRAVTISLTPEGEKMRRLIDRKRDECEKRLLAGFRDTDVLAVRQGLDMLLEAMKKVPADHVSDR
jgi:DNA-binding MarR family transcriptional regulator